LLFLKFHNRCLDTRLAKTLAEAQRLTRWHFQWVIVNDFLKAVVGAELFARPADAPHVSVNRPTIPTLKALEGEPDLLSKRSTHQACEPRRLIARVDVLRHRGDTLRVGVGRWQRCLRLASNAWQRVLTSARS
jgi:hypothetical protein